MWYLSTDNSENQKVESSQRTYVMFIGTRLHAMLSGVALMGQMQMEIARFVTKPRAEACSA